GRRSAGDPELGVPGGRDGGARRATRVVRLRRDVHLQLEQGPSGVRVGDEMMWIDEHQDPPSFRVNRRAFVSAEILEAEQRQIFDRTWLYVGHASEVPDAGDFVTRDVGGRPMIMNRGRDGALRVFFNTCRHRGAEVCRNARGTARYFTCF